MHLPQITIGAILIAAVATVGLAAQNASLSGTWAVTAAAAQGATANGGSWSRSAIASDLVLHQSGDELKGTWKGPKGDVWQLAGRVQGSRFEVRSETRELPGTRNGKPVSAPFTWTIRGTVEGNALKGVLILSAADDEEERPQPFSATRRK